MECCKLFHFCPCSKQTTQGALDGLAEGRFLTYRGCCLNGLGLEGGGLMRLGPIVLGTSLVELDQQALVQVPTAALHALPCRQPQGMVGGPGPDS